MTQKQFNGRLGGEFQTVECAEDYGLCLLHFKMRSFEWFLHAAYNKGSIASLQCYQLWLFHVHNKWALSYTVLKRGQNLPNLQFHKKYVHISLRNFNYLKSKMTVVKV